MFQLFVNRSCYVEFMKYVTGIKKHDIFSFLHSLMQARTLPLQHAICSWLSHFFSIRFQGTHACRSGSDCRDTNSQFVCPHGDTVFCCPQQGVNLTIVNNVIASCTCVSSGHSCNVTVSSSASNRPTVGLASKLLMFMATVLIFLFFS